MDYGYKVKTQSGEIIEGAIDAPDESSAVNILHNKGYVVLSLVSLKKGIFKSDINQVQIGSGEIIEGAIDAPDESSAVNILHNKGYVVLSLVSLKKGIFKSDINQV